MTSLQDPVRAGNLDFVPPNTRAESSGAGTSPAEDNTSAGAFQGTGRRKPLYHNGTWYPSQAALARAIGVTPSRVSEALSLGRMDTLGIGAKAGSEIGLPRMHAAREQPVASLGWYWRTQKDAAAALGVSFSAVSQYLNRGTLDKHVLKRLGVKE